MASGGRLHLPRPGNLWLFGGCDNLISELYWGSLLHTNKASITTVDTIHHLEGHTYGPDVQCTIVHEMAQTRVPHFNV